MDEHHKNKIAEAFAEEATLEQLFDAIGAHVFGKWCQADTVDEREALHAQFRALKDVRLIINAAR